MNKAEETKMKIQEKQQEEQRPDDTGNAPMLKDISKIFDPRIGEVFVDKRNAIPL